MRVTNAAQLVGTIAIVNFLGAGMVLSQQAPIGYDDTPMQPDGRWKVHDSKRPRPRSSARILRFAPAARRRHRPARQGQRSLAVADGRRGANDVADRRRRD